MPWNIAPRELEVKGGGFWRDLLVKGFSEVKGTHSSSKKGGNRKCIQGKGEEEKKIKNIFFLGNGKKQDPAN